MCVNVLRDDKYLRDGSPQPNGIVMKEIKFNKETRPMLASKFSKSGGRSGGLKKKERN